MIETTQTVPIDVGIEAVWDYVKDIRRWAELVPGLQNCQIVNDDDSRWILKVGVGALVRTVKVDVHVDQWDGPSRAVFSYKLVGDPVQGEGSYIAVATGDRSIDMTLSIKVRGSGPMAPMWEAMGAPLMPKFVRAFAEQLAQGIESEMAGASGEGAVGGTAARKGPIGLLRWLWCAFFGRRRKSP